MRSIHFWQTVLMMTAMLVELTQGKQTLLKAHRSRLQGAVDKEEKTGELSICSF